MQFWLLQVGAEQSETAMMRSFSARKVMCSPGFESGVAMEMEPSGAMRAFMKVLKGVENKCPGLDSNQHEIALTSPSS